MTSTERDRAARDAVGDLMGVAPPAGAPEGRHHGGRVNGAGPLRAFTTAELPDHVGQVLGTSADHRIDQERVDAFARVTGDDQWIHVDPGRARAAGGTIVHGHLLLSLIPVMSTEAFTVTDAVRTVNHRLDGVRFRAPVPTGEGVRGRFRLTGARPRVRDWYELVLGVEIELLDGPVVCRAVQTYLCALRT
ncbi:MaoC/PaaZ C-terminal domain-containing protein [Streptomyces xiamenensis]|uniref:MaoC/PaaZ C-terminal domain-containing protein n=1 Tax=Streptomyces xiamenensis TaxID=408015 RepID=UPI0035E35F31